MMMKMVTLLDEFNRGVDMVQQDLPEWERFSPSELAQRKILIPALVRDEAMAIQKIAADAIAAYGFLQYDAAKATLPRVSVSGWNLSQSVVSENRSQYLQRALFWFRNIVNEICRLQSESIAGHSIQQNALPIPMLPVDGGGQNVQIYQAAPIKNDNLLIPKDEKGAREVAEMLAGTGFVYTYADEFYILTNYPRRFKKLEGKDVQRMIGSFVKGKGIDISPLQYDEVKKCLLYDSQIQVVKEPGLSGYIWPFADGLVDIRDGRKIENRRQYFYCVAFSCDYIPTAACPVFDQFLYGISGGDSGIIDLLWKMIGYILSDDMSGKVFFVFRGPKDTGKSLLANVICSLLEDEAVASMGIAEIGKRFTMAELVDKKLTVCMDLTDEPLDPATVGAVKTITGGDLVRAEGKYQAGRSVHIKSKLLFGTNHEVRLKKADLAFNERLVEIPFLYPVPKEKQNRDLLNLLKRELPGIAVKASKAYLSLVANNYNIALPAIMIPQGMAFDDEKIIVEFASEKCDFSDKKARVFTKDLFHAYEDFCHERKLQAVEMKKFSEIFNSQNTEVEKKKININGQILQGYVGVRLKV